MIRVTLKPDFESFREKARALIALGMAPNDLVFEEEGPERRAVAGSFGSGQTGSAEALWMPPAYVPLAEEAACFRDPARWAVLYRVLWRSLRGERELLALDADPDVRRLEDMARAVRRDEQRMRATLRFRHVSRDGGERCIAWYAPEHLVLRRVSPYFKHHFAALHWSILTPDGSAHWDGDRLSFGEGAARSEAPAGGALCAPSPTR